MQFVCLKDGDEGWTPFQHDSSWLKNGPIFPVVANDMKTQVLQ